MKNRKPYQTTAAVILAIAAQHGVSYTPIASDAWADDATRLADDDVSLDEIELILIALQRSGHLSKAEALQLQMDHLREAKNGTSNDAPPLA